jgi:hypothetical protein
MTTIRGPHLAASLTAVLACVGTLDAQTPFTSPLGFDAVEGNSDFATFFTPRRLQQIDATQIGRPAANIGAIAFRQNGTFAGANALPRTATMTVTMGHGDFGALTDAFATNYVDVPTTVVAPRTVNIPDWSQAPAARPAAFTFLTLFDQPFSYDGVRAVVFDVVVENLSRSGDMYVDRENRISTRQSGTVIGTGCVATGQATPLSHFLAAITYPLGHPQYGLRLEHSGGNAPANASVWLLLGPADPGLTFPGLCGTLHAAPPVDVLRAPASASGFLSTQFLDLPPQPGLAGQSVYSQYLALDPGQPILPLALSNGRVTTIPAPPVELRCAYHFAAPSAASATVFAGTGVIVQFLH